MEIQIYLWVKFPSLMNKEIYLKLICKIHLFNQLKTNSKIIKPSNKSIKVF